MKYNQFGRVQQKKDQEIFDLINIKILPENYLNLSFKDLLQTIFSNFFPNAKSDEAVKQEMALIAVNESQNLWELVNQDIDDLSQTDFYNVALHFLGYHLDEDFAIDNPIALFKENDLPYLNADKFDRDNFLRAIYLLLNTRAKNSMTLIDNLAGQGYFTKFYDLDNPYFIYFNGKSMPVFDTSKIIAEKVYIESDFDTDFDGKRDLLEATIFRPIESNQLSVPILYTADPYFGGTNDVDHQLHNVDENLTDATLAPSFMADKISPMTKLNPDTEDESVEFSTNYQTIYTLNDYMLARGFATVYAGGFGTSNSDGFRSTGSELETACAKEVIEWLTGNRIAYTTRLRDHQTKAWWSNNKIAMTGKSYLGTLATAVATTGVEGLKTIISEAAISSWYDYYREHGLVVAPAQCQGEDLDVLGDLCQTNFNQSALYLKNRAAFLKSQQNITTKQDRQSGQYSNFWDVRNYRNNLKNIKCSVVMVHGLNDDNVKPKNVYKLFNALNNFPIKTKLFLHQGKHTYMNSLASIDFTDCMNLWLTHELLGHHNQAFTNWGDCLIQDNLKSDFWHEEASFNNNLGSEKNYFLAENENLSTSIDSTQTLTFEDVGGKLFHELKLTEAQWEQQFMIGDDNFSSAQLRFISQPLSETTTIIGRPEIALAVSSSRKYGQLSVALVDFGKRSRLGDVAQNIGLNNQPLGFDFGYETQKEFMPAPPSNFKIISKGFCNIQNYADLKHPNEVKPNEFYQLNFQMQPTYYSLPKGSELGLIIYSTDMGMTKRPQENTTYSLNLAKSFLRLAQK